MLQVFVFFLAESVREWPYQVVVELLRQSVLVSVVLGGCFGEHELFQAQIFYLFSAYDHRGCVLDLVEVIGVEQHAFRVLELDEDVYVEGNVHFLELDLFVLE